MRLTTLYVLLCGLWSSASGAVGAPDEDPLRVVFLAGRPDDHPPGTHEYEKSCRLLAHALRHAPEFGPRPGPGQGQGLSSGSRAGSPGRPVETQVFVDAWPEDPAVLEQADTFVLVTAGSDRRREDHPLLVGDRLAQLEREVQRGCGLVVVHWSTFVPRDEAGARFMDWIGGHFDYESGPGPRGWASAIQVTERRAEPVLPAARAGSTPTSEESGARVTPAQSHPVLRGVRPFTMREEWYYRLRLADPAPGFSPLIQTTFPGEEQAQTVAWAMQRPDGGRGFGTTGGHFLSNYSQPGFRRLLLNAIVWTAGGEVPEAGVGGEASDPIRATIVTGQHHPAHDWTRTTPALVDVLQRDPRMQVTVTEDVEAVIGFASEPPDLVIWNHCNWQAAGLSRAAREAFLSWLEAGGGLVLVHFANGAFHPSLPGAPEGQAWPAWHQRVVRRAWDHASGASGHDAYGPFEVRVTPAQHPVTAGLRDWTTYDELYYRQAGQEPIVPLLEARSRDTGRAEPLAWSYEVGQGQVFQTLLGHDERSLRVPATAALVQRAAAWVAGRAPMDLPLSPAATAEVESASAEGRFGAALNGAAGRRELPGSEEFGRPPFTVDCWTRLEPSGAFQVAVSHQDKDSGTHWELYSYAGSGVFSVYLPGYEPADLRSGKVITDGEWHHLAFTFDGTEAALFVDAQEVLRQSVQRSALPAKPGPLYLAGAVHPGHEVSCEGLLDELRIRRGVHAPSALPQAAPTPDADVLGLWSLDEVAEETPGEDSKPDGASAAGTGPARPDRTASIPEGFVSPAAWTPPYREGDPESEREQDWVDPRFSRMDTGPFLSASVETPGGRVRKALALRLGEGREASALFDTQSLRLRARWSGRFLDLSPVRFGLLELPRIAAPAQWSVGEGPRMGQAAKVGTPPGEGHWRGLSLHGERTVLEYELQGRRVLDLPWVRRFGELLVHTEDFEVSPGSAELQRILDDQSLDGWEPIGVAPGLRVLAYRRGDEVQVCAISGDEFAALHSDGFGRWLSIPASQGTVRLRAWLWRGPAQQLPAFWSSLLHAVSWVDVPGATFDPLELPPMEPREPLESLEGLTQGGPARWHPLPGTGRLGEAQGAYAVDTLQLPFDNPWGALLFTAGVDFLPGGDLAVCTAHGDVWVVSDLAEDLSTATWTRFATGLYQPLGLRVLDGVVHVLGRDQITRLHDRDGNGEADHYECFNAGLDIAGDAHAYAMGLESDAGGNLYFQKSGSTSTRHGGTTVKVAADGASLESIAYGFRHANGIGVGPGGLVTNADNQGEWIPATRINALFRPDYHGGYVPSYRGEGDAQAYDPPLCWIPHAVDNSAGGQVWVPGDAFGLPRGTMLHSSYGRCRLMVVLPEVVEGIPQAGVVALPHFFESGICRGRFTPQGDALWLTGLEGWQTAAMQDGCLQRLRYLGGPLHLPTALRVRADGVFLTFAEPLDPASVSLAAFEVQRWNYRYAAKYGSEDWSVQDPQRIGRDPVGVQDAELQPDGRTVRLGLAVLEPVMQQRIAWTLRAADGDEVQGELHHTIHQVAPADS